MKVLVNKTELKRHLGIGTTPPGSIAPMPKSEIVGVEGHLDIALDSKDWEELESGEIPYVYEDLPPQYTRTNRPEGVIKPWDWYQLFDFVRDTLYLHVTEIKLTWLNENTVRVEVEDLEPYEE